MSSPRPDALHSAQYARRWQPHVLRSRRKRPTRRCRTPLPELPPSSSRSLSTSVSLLIPLRLVLHQQLRNNLIEASRHRRLSFAHPHRTHRRTWILQQRSKNPRRTAPANGCRPVAISNITLPEREQIRASIQHLPLSLLGRHISHSPQRRSGTGQVRIESRVDRLRAAVGCPPNIAVASPDSARSPTPCCFANPKSRILICRLPSAPTTKIFAGLISRCTIPCACAAASALAICFEKVTTSVTDKVSCRSASFSVSPRSNSITR